MQPRIEGVFLFGPTPAAEGDYVRDATIVRVRCKETNPLYTIGKGGPWNDLVRTLLLIPYGLGCNILEGDYLMHSQTRLYIARMRFWYPDYSPEEAICRYIGEVGSRQYGTRQVVDCMTDKMKIATDEQILKAMRAARALRPFAPITRGPLYAALRR